MRLCPWSLALASSIPVLGLESVCPRKGCPRPWPRICFVWLALASSLVSSTPPLLYTTCVDYCPLWNTEKNFCILNNLVMFGDAYIMQLRIFDFPKFVYYTDNILINFLFKKWHKFLSSWQLCPKFFQNSRPKLVIFTNFLASKLLRDGTLIL